MFYFNSLFPQKLFNLLIVIIMWYMAEFKGGDHDPLTCTQKKSQIIFFFSILCPQTFFELDNSFNYSEGW